MFQHRTSPNTTNSPKRRKSRELKHAQICTRKSLAGQSQPWRNNQKHILSQSVAIYPSGITRERDVSVLSESFCTQTWAIRHAAPRNPSETPS
eukprot:2693852-Rhodomonas_salina.1